jgi:hypothetical protein
MSRCQGHRYAFWISVAISLSRRATGQPLHGLNLTLFAREVRS